MFTKPPYISNTFPEKGLSSTKQACEDVTKNFWTCRLERELQMLQLSATKTSCIAIL
jgi:hypothetical protein